MNFAWAPGNVVGAAAGGGIAEAVGDVASYGVLAGLCAVTLVLVQGLRRQAALAAAARSPSPG
jgi:hypothetical protein